MISKSLIVSEERRKDEESQLRSRKMNILMMRIMEEMTMMIMMILRSIILMKMMRVRGKASNFLLKKYLDFHKKIVILYFTNKKVVLIKLFFLWKRFILP